MLDPASIALAYGGCKAAINGVRELVDLYRQAKTAGKDVASIASEVTTLCGSFFSHSESITAAEQQKAAELKANPKARLKSLNDAALDNVMNRRKLIEMEAELRELLVYHLDMPGIWSEFTAERERIREERLQAERDLQKQLAEEARARQRRIDRYSLLITKWFGGIVVLIVFCTLMYGIRLDYQTRRVDDFSRAEFERRWATDPKVIDCWKAVQGTGVLPRFCLKDPE
jgi:hypothetical protein